MANEPSEFDPYHKWFGIPSEEQPPNHYRLLRISVFESDPDVIENAYDTAMSELKRHEIGEHGDLVEQLGREFLAARRCLLTPQNKSEYDQTLRKQLTPERISDSPPPSRPASPPARANTPVPTQQPSELFTPSPTIPTATLVTNPQFVRPEAPARNKLIASSSRRRSSFQKPIVVGLLLAGFTCIALIVVGIVLARFWSNGGHAENNSQPSEDRVTKNLRTIDWTKHGIRDWGPINGKNEIHVKKAISPNSWLLSRRTYTDFVLTAQYAIEDGGAGGIYVRVPADARFPWNQGFEIHFADDFGEPPSQEGTGAVYKRAQPASNQGRPVNQWNDVRVECRGHDLSVWLNGKLVVDYRIPDTFTLSGHLGLDGVNGGITYRNVRVRPIAADRT